MKKEKTELEEDMTLDLREKELNFMSWSIENGEPVHKLVFENIIILLNDKQMKRLES